MICSKVSIQIQLSFCIERCQNIKNNMNGYILTYMWCGDMWVTRPYHLRQNALDEVYRMLEKAEACDVIQDEIDNPDFESVIHVVDTSTGKYSDFGKDQATLDKIINLIYGDEFCYTLDEIKYVD